MFITMTPKNIQITFVGMEPTEALKKYTRDKISKYKKLWEEATTIEVFLKENVNAKGVKNDFKVDINVYLPKNKVRVEEKGEDMYANIDKATDTLARQLKKTEEKSHFWELKRPWKILGIGKTEEDEEIEEEKHYAYIPKIKSRKELNKLERYQEQEAIERMEMSGFDQMMFRHRETGKICMAYKRKEGYGLVVLNEEE
jgi:putative sigma-54 modulation protein